MNDLFTAFAILAVPALIVMFLIVGNLKAISKCFEKSERPAGRCFLMVWVTTAWKLSLLFAILMTLGILASRSVSRGESVAAIGWSVFIAFVWGAFIGFFPAVAAGIGAKWSEDTSKKVMAATLVAEILLVLLVGAMN